MGHRTQSSRIERMFFSSVRRRTDFCCCTLARRASCSPPHLGEAELATTSSCQGTALSTPKQRTRRRPPGRGRQSAVSAKYSDRPSHRCGPASQQDLDGPLGGENGAFEVAGKVWCEFPTENPPAYTVAGLEQRDFKASIFQQVRRQQPDKLAPTATIGALGGTSAGALEAISVVGACEVMCVTLAASHGAAFAPVVSPAHARRSAGCGPRPAAPTRGRTG